MNVFHIDLVLSIKKNARGGLLHSRGSFGRGLVHIFISVSVRREIPGCWSIVIVFNICSTKACCSSSFLLRETNMAVPEIKKRGEA
jgi:hypothetical protein